MASKRAAPECVVGKRTEGREKGQGTGEESGDVTEGKLEMEPHLHPDTEKQAPRTTVALDSLQPGVP